MSALDQAVSEAQRAGAEAWPGIAVELDALRGFLAERASGDGPPLAQLCLEDLFLACALSSSSPAAMVAFENGLMPAVTAAARRASATVDVDEVRQVVRDILFVGSGARAPAIARYSGRGNLKAWLRVISTRETYRIARRTKGRVSASDDDLYDVLTGVDQDPELEHLKRTYRDKFRAAFAVAVTELERRERTALRLQVLDGLSIDEIGRMYGAHRATAARWLARARERLLKGTRKALAVELGIARVEVDSIIRMISSRLDVSLHGLLQSRDDNVD